ncbi:nicastrin [Pectinophora gossypiella]|uniref:nicastrin n=1 Tax=Pectinophora gossypiella TaxID=13191 RepID=UPI00214E72D1|nr:nicastrin [Pectinophora gossypiella]
MFAKMISSYISVLLTILIISKFTYCERLHEQIYSSIEGGAACFRRLNGTHQAGCTSSDKGAVGVVHMVSSVSDVQWLVHNSSAGPYMAVVSTSLFYDVVELLMNYPDNVAGVLLYDNATAKVDEFSQESRCPNEYYSGPGSQCSSTAAGGIVWNNKGTGLIRRDIPFPIFYLPDTRIEEVVKIQKCYERYNSDWDNQKGNPLCSLQLNSFMFAAVNSMVCMRRSASTTLLTANKVCDPLGDHNVYYSLFPRNKENPATKKPVHLVTARIDTASLFDGMSPGAASSVVGMVTLITAAATLAKMIPVNDSQLYDSNVLWTLFNGEAFDYIGSQRVAYDLSVGAWPPVVPLTPSDVRLHVELGQLGGSLRTDGLTNIHAFFPTSGSPKITEFLQILEKNTATYNMGIVQQNTPNLPPSSLHSFRRILKNVTESGELPEVLLVDHGETFSNKFYHSVLDDFDNITFNYRNISIGSDGKFISTEDLIANGTMKESESQVKISRLSTAVARTLYEQVTKKSYTGSLTASAHLVDEMMYCFLRSQACRLLLAADYAQTGGGEESLPARAAPLYVGVAAWPGTPAVFAGHLIALLTGNHLNVNRTVCDKRANPEFSYYWLKGWNHSGICIETTMNFSQALSPAFTTPNYEYASGLYSTWTESVWRAMWARVFVAAGGGGARAAAAAGAVTTILGAITTYYLRRNSRIVFRDGSAISTDAAAGILRSVNC